jgi:hypothetical protein
MCLCALCTAGVTTLLTSHRLGKCDRRDISVDEPMATLRSRSNCRQMALTPQPIACLAAAEGYSKKSISVC